MKKVIAKFVVLGLIAAVPGYVVSAAEPDYVRDIKPILKAKCYSCHGAIKQEAGLRLDTVASIRAGGDSGAALPSGEELSSLFLHRITAADEGERMPPEGEPLSVEQLQRVTAWLAAGAPAPADEKAQKDPAQHWAFQPLGTVEPPPGPHPIDAFIDRQLSAAGLSRAPAADPVTLIRRLYLDLHGLPPEPDQVDYWASRLDSPQSVRALMDALLNSPRYGERWGQHWLDIVRYADTHGFEVNTPRPNAWPYRDYVIQSFNSDKPYNRFVFEQLAGDTVEADAATGFMVAAAALLPGQIGKDEESRRQARQDELDEIIVGTTATFLGLTVGCARCHDHKFDPIPQTDYYAMQAFFAGVDYGDREVRGPDFQQRLADADRLQPQIDQLRQLLSSFQPTAFAGRTIVIDDEDVAMVTPLAVKNGHGANPAGTARGFRDDVGDAQRFGNLSRGRYTWWDNHPGQDVFTWNPRSAGRFRLWVSWGVHGSGVHTRDARYVLDTDGDLTTTEDQKEVARGDQYYFAGMAEGETQQTPLWSGLLDAGVHEFTDATRLILRGGDTGTGITADVIVLQEEAVDSRTTVDHERRLPRLRGPVSALKTVERFEPVQARYVRFTSLETIDNNRHEPCLDELEVFTADDPSVNVALADRGTVPTSSGNYSDVGQHQLKHINDGRYGNSHSWISNESGKGWVQLQFPETHTIDRIEWARDRDGKFADRLPVRYQITTSKDGQTWTVVATSDDRLLPGTPHDDMQALLRSGASAEAADLAALAAKLQALEQRQAELRRPQVVFAGQFRKPDPTFLLNRGDPEQRLEQISPRGLTRISSLQLDKSASDTERRVALGNWIAAPENPLTSRVIVNRIWQYHFGTGLVETASDFGLNGAQPTHPELLDWLARELIREDWSLKHIHRLILSSGTYQQASTGQTRSEQETRTADPRVVDAGNRLLWHFPSRRLEAEAIRDSMLQVSGRLNLKMGGPGFDFFRSRGGLSGFPPVEEFTENELRRMIYAHKIRMEPVPVFGAFDCPDAGLPTPRRSQSTTAIQALNLFNSPFVIDQSQHFAERVRSGGNDKVDEQVEAAFRLAVGRSPTPHEKTAAAEAVNTYGLPTLCRALFNSSEFLFLP
ncbi:MAG: DUF1553 domain-containing protein [Fuerstiella sp.]